MADDLVLHTYLGDVAKSEPQPDGSLMVYGIATGPQEDLDYQACDPEWLREAMPKWMQSRANIREQHRADSAIGKGQHLREGDDGNWYLAAKIVDPVAVKKFQEGVYTGFSIGVKGATVKGHPKYRNGLICGGRVIEVSGVDFPAYEYSKVATTAEEVGFPVMKAVGANRYAYAGAVVDGNDDPETVAKAISQPRRAYVVRPGITTPEEILAMTQAKSVEPDLAKKDYSTEDRVKLAKQGLAIPVKNDKGDVVDGRYPIQTAKDVDNAARSIGRTPEGERDEVKAHIKQAAKKIGAESALPDDWSDSSKAVEPDLQKDGPNGQLPTLTGDEAKHNSVIQAAQANIAELITQELSDLPQMQNWCDIQELACIGRALVHFGQGEAQDNDQGSGMPDNVSPSALPLADVVLMAAQLEPEQRGKTLTQLAKTLQPDAAKAADGDDQDDEAKKPFPGAAPPFKKKPKKGDEDEDEKDGRDEDPEKGSGGDDEVKAALAALQKALQADVAKEGRTISAATASALTSLAQTPGTPNSVRAALLSMAGVKDPDGPTFDENADGEDTSDAPGPQGITSVIAPSPINLMSPVDPHTETNTGPGFDGDDTGKAVTLGDFIRKSIQSQLEEFVTSDVFVTKLAEGGQAKVVAVEATEVAKTAAADLTKQVNEVEELRKSLALELHKRDAEIERIKALPQAPRAMAAELPKGVHAVDREHALTDHQKAESPNPELDELLQKMTQGSVREQVLAQQRIREIMQGASRKDQEGMLEATYAASRRS